VKRENELYPFRRHLRRCKFFGLGGREIALNKCACPFHVDGLHHGTRVRQSLKTTSRQLADRRLTALIRKLDEQRRQGDAGDERAGTGNRMFSEAVDRFLLNYGELDQNRKFTGVIQYGTWRKYRTKLTLLLAFCKSEGIIDLRDVTIEVLEDFRRTRKIGLVTWKVELQALRTFFGYFVRRRWIAANPAKDIKSPRNIKPNDIVPYTLREESEILAACAQIGGRCTNDFARAPWYCCCGIQPSAFRTYAPCGRTLSRGTKRDPRGAFSFVRKRAASRYSCRSQTA
jgi:hypothetical protein